jgi:broad specificity phosphatase PhoE
MQQRVLGYLSDLNVDSTDGTTLITAHDGTINAISASFLGEEMGVADLTHNSHSFVAKFEVNNKKVASFEEV